MATRKNIDPQFVDNSSDDDEVIVDEPVTVVNSDSDFVTAKVKGTWVMFWGSQKFNFTDGQRYKLPKDLFNYLRNSGNIYDTL